MSRSGGTDALFQRALMLWAGLALGVAFVATPAKFLAPSLLLPVALDVGRHTFALYNRVELVLIAALLVLTVFAESRRRLLIALTAPIVLVLVETAWLLPALDRRVAAILAGHPPGASNLHGAYIVVEALKIGILVMFGLSGRAGPVAPPRARRHRPGAEMRPDSGALR